MSFPFNPYPSYSFNIANKIQFHFLLPQISIGPDQYNPKIDKKGETLNVDHTDSFTPAPLHYTINTIRSQGVSFPNSKKAQMEPTLSPGPGQYLPVDEPHSRLGGSISRTSRDNNFDNKIPEAGHYPIKSKLNSLGFKFKQLHKRAKTDHMSPGPGFYSILKGFMNHGIKMHNSKRIGLIFQKQRLLVLEPIKMKALLKIELHSNIQYHLSKNNQRYYINAILKVNQNYLIRLKLKFNPKQILILMKSYQKDKDLSLIIQSNNKTLVMLIINLKNMVNQK